MEYGEFNSINTSLVEYERTTKKLPTMKSLDADKKASKTSEAAPAAAEVKAEPEKIDFSKVKVEPLFEEFVDFDTFSKSDFRAVKVKECVAVPKSKKLLQFTLDDGTGTDRTILSGIHSFYEPEELVGKTLIAITNLPPRAMMGIDSLQIAVDDDFIRNNPSDNVLRELKKAHCFQSEKRRALTKPEQELFLNFLKTHPVYEHWYPVFAVMIGTGLRVGEVTGLRWCDIDMESGMIDVNHTLVYYDHRTEGSKSGCYFNVNTTKTPASMRQVPMLGFVKEAFEHEKQKQEDLGLHCEVTIDGYTDFIFINRFGQAQHQATLNKAIRRIIRDCNDEQFLHSDEPDVLLPHFSCHSLRHTFTTRMCEAGVNIKVIQDALGHSDISTTLNIYADVTKEMKAEEFKGLDSYFKV